MKVAIRKVMRKRRGNLIRREDKVYGSKEKIFKENWLWPDPRTSNSS